MGYSKEAERQNEVLGSLLKGETPEKRVMVGYEGVKESGGDKISHLTDIMKEARMPWFCPDCKKVMKQRLDDKFWRIFGHCFDCQIQFDNKLRIAGTYKEWYENKIRENKIAYIKDQIQAIEEWKNMKGPEFYNNVGVDYPELEKEKWDVDMDKVRKEADEAIKKFTEVLNELESVE